MAINSYGYPRDISPGSVFSRFSESFGHRYSVDGFADFRVTIASTGTRRVNIAAGWSLGKGVKVQNTAQAFKELAAPSGSTQWFLIGLKRWITNPAYDPEADPGTPEGSPYISDIVVVNGTASRAVPTVVQNAGTDDTQWLGLARVISGSTAVQEVVDLRLISGEGGGGYQVFSEEAMAQVAGLVGTEVYRADTTGGHVPTYYKVVSSSTGVLSWKNMSKDVITLNGLASGDLPPSGWSRISDGCKMVRNGNHRKLVYNVQRSGGGGNAFTSNSRGGLGDMHIGILHAEDRPGSGMAIPLIGRVQLQDGGATYGVFGHITSIGNIYLHSMLPNVEVVPGDDFFFTGDWYVP